MKAQLLTILTHPIVGRPIRKFFYLQLVLVEWLQKKLATFYSNLPYVRTLDMSAKADSQPAVLWGYYKQLNAQIRMIGLVAEQRAV